MTLTFNQLSALTTNKFLPRVIDNVFTSKAMISRFTKAGNMKMMDGGIKIQGPIIQSEPGASGRWYSGYDTLSSDATDDLTAFTVDWKQLQEPVRISRKELLQNSGDSAKLSLLRSKMEIAQKNITERIGKGFFSDGTAATGDLTTKQLTGTAALLSTSSSYEGIAVADMAEWVAQVNENSGTDRPLTLNLMQAIFGAASIDAETPTVACSKQNVFDQAWALFQPHQRLVNAEMKALGFRSLEFNGIPLVVDSHCPDNQMQFFNEKHFYMVTHRQQNFRIVNFPQLETFDGILNRIEWMGNLVCDARRLHGLLDDIAVAS